MRKALKLRTGRVISICRLAVASALLATDLLETDGFSQITEPKLLVILGYLGFAGCMLAVTRFDWWLSHRLRKLGFAVDFAVAYVLLYLTEVAVTGAISPFMALFIFLLLSATLLWQTKGAVVATVLGVVAYLLVGLVLQASGEAQANPWFARRLVFMIAIAGFVLWFGLQRRRLQAARLDWPMDASVEEQFATIAQFVLNHINATGVAIAWSPQEEPWTIVYRAGSLDNELQKVGPQDAPDALMNLTDAMLFDRSRDRALQLAGDGRILASKGPVDAALAVLVGVETGIVAPIQSQIGGGAILLTGIRSVSGDHLLPAKLLADELGYALDRHEMLLLMQKQEIIRLRADFARDLHDTVAQSLAGSEFRLGAVRQTYAAGGDITAELAAIQEALGKEAGLVHAMITQLRKQEPQARVIEASENLRSALHDAANRWGIASHIAIDGKLGSMRTWLVRELELIGREAVANAVRHAGARNIHVTVERTPVALLVQIRNDGSDFPQGGDGARPQSISERVTELGGTMQIDQDEGQTRLSIILPIGTQA